MRLVSSISKQYVGFLPIQTHDVRLMHTILLCVHMHSALQVLGITDHPHADCGVVFVTWTGVLAVDLRFEGGAL
jgi:hypothetical protein